MPDRAITRISQFVFGPPAVSLWYRADRWHTLYAAWLRIVSPQENLFSTRFGIRAQEAGIHRRTILLIALNTLQVLSLSAVILILLADFLKDRHIGHLYLPGLVASFYLILALADYFGSAPTDNLNVALDSISNSVTSADVPRTDEGRSASSVETLMKRHSLFDEATKKKILESVAHSKGSEEQVLADSTKKIEEAWSKSEHGKLLDVSTYDSKGKRP